MTRERCQNCAKFTGLHFYSPLWEQIAGRHKHDIWCLPCFAMTGDERGVAWEEGLEIQAVSLVTHLTIRRVEEKKKDNAFMSRLHESLRRNEPILKRLADGTDLTSDLVKEARKWHSPHELNNQICNMCRLPYPCLIIRLADALEEAERRLEKAEALLGAAKPPYRHPYGTGGNPEGGGDGS